MVPEVKKALASSLRVDNLLDFGFMDVAVRPFHALKAPLQRLVCPRTCARWRSADNNWEAGA